jgi:hypothetical protein
MCAGGALCGFSSFGLVSLPLFGFRPLVGVSFCSFLFFFFSLLLLYVGVANALMNGRLRTMCGSRTGGWSLPCVMSV